jgi:hypothetical protein
MLLFFSFLIKSDMMWAPPVADMQPIPCQLQFSDLVGPTDRLSKAV